MEKQNEVGAIVHWLCALPRKYNRLYVQGPVHESGRLVHVKTPPIVH